MYKINFWLLVICTSILLSACDKKEYSVDDFKSNKQLLSEYISKCHSQKSDSDFWNCQHAYKAEDILAFTDARDEVFNSVRDNISSTEIRAQGKLENSYLIEKYQNGMLWVEKDFSPELFKSFDDFYVSALGGYAPAQYELGRLYLQDNVPVAKDIKSSLRKTHNIGKAFAFLKLSADQGYVDAQSEIASFYSNAFAYSYTIDESVDVANDHAFYWFSKAANSGDTYSEFMLARMYIACSHPIISGIPRQCKKMKSPEENLSMVMKLYLSAAKKNDRDSIFELMNIYKDGLYSIPKNESEYAKWRKKLSEPAN